MNCLKVRQEILADPQHIDEATHSHLASCSACRKFDQEIRSLDRDLAEAFKVPVPEDLSARVLLNQSLRKPPARSFLPLAIAAALVLASVVVFTYRTSMNEPVLAGAMLAEAMLSHMPHEEQLVEEATNLIHQRKIQAVLNRINASSTGDLEGIVYASLCIIDGQEMAHLAIEENGIHYTVMVIPTRAFDSPTYFENDRWEGVASSRGAATVAVLAHVVDQNGKTSSQAALFRKAAFYQELFQVEDA